MGASSCGEGVQADAGVRCGGEPSVRREWQPLEVREKCVTQCAADAEMGRVLWSLPLCGPPSIPWGVWPGCRAILHVRDERHAPVTVGGLTSWQQQDLPG